MSRLKTLPVAAAVIALTLGAAVARADPPVSDNAPSPLTGPANHFRDKSLTARGLTAASDAVGKIGDAFGTGVQALDSGVQRATGRAADLIQHAMSLIGAPYRWGGTSTETGFDCSGFVRAMFQQTFGKLLPRRAVEQAAATQSISKDELEPGDLVFFNTLRHRAYSHVGIYLGDGKFIHAPSRGERVRIDSLDLTYWQTHFEGARRVLIDESTPALASAADAPSLIVPTATVPFAARSGTVPTAITDMGTARQDLTGRANHAAYLVTDVHVADAATAASNIPAVNGNGSVTSSPAAPSAISPATTMPAISAPVTVSSSAPDPGNARHRARKQHARHAAGGKHAKKHAAAAPHGSKHGKASSGAGKQGSNAAPHHHKKKR